MEGLGLEAEQGLGIKDDILMQTAKQEYPVLQGLGLNYKYSPGAQRGYLEFWPPQETGTPEWPRPKEFPQGGLGLEVYDPNTRPIDIMGDVASHHLVYNDPKMKSYYSSFEESLTPIQKKRLQAQYEWAQQNESEQRPYEDWYQATGLPGYFRGYAFQQWPDAKSAYTPAQLKMFDEMMNYLRSAR
jgi:hypothetical protein